MSIKKFSYLGIFGMVCLSAVIAGCGPTEAERKAEAEKQLKLVEEAKIELLKERLKSALKDPVSAQFQGLKYVAESNSLCGQVNAKNAFGGYVGFKWFGVSMDSNPVILRRLDLKQVIETEKYLNEYAVSMHLAGDTSAIEEVATDEVLRAGFKHWDKCAI